jgi:hypothetical protein
MANHPNPPKSVNIRIARESDFPVIEQLFVNSMLYGRAFSDFCTSMTLLTLAFSAADSPVRAALKYYSKRLFAFTIIVVLLCAHAFRKPTSLYHQMATVVLPTICVLGSCFILYKVRGRYHEFCRTASETDLGNIGRHYGLIPSSASNTDSDNSDFTPPGPNCVWVAEVSTEDGPEVVGCVGLGERIWTLLYSSC